ncbi:MAG: DNA gyrase subunit A [Nitrospirae bacterium CG_4_10_14_0_8_um_filter_41_23]|nr:MAG: DNA gyrase subunit A [Nitrospirae bacterium CG11_big_fil_rev_8_21_14_0_20_41_14]PIV44832.1 MAG: DNA gyrase subunit A [Nitrospirae bacterium CG02_land_8_20_14_3_00_41_53]PIW86580.1 MAG: DNA gyrase subunit A [Nitrospirae bacterium CG_4_8_14_3_um_filter_41_47]PIY86674.1 MAG: DNA gyrase subunit A [Nitrospirae bacterium CG_4_10_14_0_8_um_filter_41_23]PJA80590.1 MAG: DNA gyrase subunit A [Nitrospirae bacterium CG_4_9_14_3_um_filter_41_27]
MAKVPVSIEEEMKSSYLDYAMSVIIGRALPEVRDGLKPVQRRILYAMFREGLLPGKRYSKCAGVVGEVLKKYHPHGDTAVYDALVRLAQDFNMRYPLVDGQGNFGSVDGDPAAAYRYTEARLAGLAEELLSDIDKDTVDFILNFDETTEEPVVLPSRVPNLIINGSSGIAVGMATNIPPHNIGEIIDGLVILLENPDAGLKDLMSKIKGPDFPTGGIIHGTDGIIQAYNEGRGLIKVRAKARIEREHRGGESIIITELPYQVNKARLIEKIAELVREKKIEGVSELRDESDRDGIRIVLELKRGEMAQVILNNLYKHTQMETTFGIIMLALVNTQPRILKLKELLKYFLQHRRNVVIRRTHFELKKAEERAHILEGLKIALDYLDEIIALIKRSTTPNEARIALMRDYPLSEIQAQAILDMKLQRLTGLEREKIIEEFKDILKEIERLKAILGSDALVSQIIKEDLLAIRNKYADERRTEITSETKEITIEDLITDEEMVITLSHQGYIKRNPLSAYRSQRRGGKGSIGMETKEEDFVRELFIGATHDYMLFFSNLGRLYWLKAYQVPEAGRAAKGKALVNLLALSEGERITTALPVRDFKEGFLVIFTKNGIVKKTALEKYSNPRGKGIIALTLDKGNELIAVRKTDGKSDLIIGTKNGFSIRFNEENVRDTGRTAKGVKGIRLMKGDEVVSSEVAEERTALLTVTEKGLGKRSKIEDYPVQNRGGKGVISIKTIEKGGKAVGLMQVRDEDEVVMITSSGKLIRTLAGNISLHGRNTQGVKLMDVEGEDKIVSIGRVAERD